MEEMRRRLDTEELEDPHPDETSPSDSQASSVEVSLSILGIT